MASSAGQRRADLCELMSLLLRTSLTADVLVTLPGGPLLEHRLSEHVERIDLLDLRVPVAHLERQPRGAERLALRDAAAGGGARRRLGLAGDAAQQVDAAGLGVPTHARRLGRFDVRRRLLVAGVVA